MSNDTTVDMEHRPVCDICAREGNYRRASYDAKTLMVGGPWAYLCETHFRSHTNGELGLGKGQKIIKIEREVNR